MPDLRVELGAFDEGGHLGYPIGFKARVVNDGREVAIVRFGDMGAPSLVLRVERRVAGGAWERVFLHPPPLPDLAAEDDRIHPGEDRGADFRYVGFLDPSLPPGTYRARYVGRHPTTGGRPDDPLLSKCVSFVVEPHSLDYGERGGCLPCLAEFIRCIFRRPRTKACKATFESRVLAKRFQKIEKGLDASCTGGMTATQACKTRVGLYDWTPCFTLRISEEDCVATLYVKISYHVLPDVDQPSLSAIEIKIKKQWHDTFRICPVDSCCPEGYPIHLELEFVAAASSPGEHHHVTFDTETKDMLIWSNGGQNVAHEFGHMLGAFDEYCEVNDVLWCAAGQGDGQMNSSAKPAQMRNWEQVRLEASQLLDRECEIVSKATPCPPPEE